MVAPPCRDAAAEHPSFKFSVAARPRHNIEDANLQHVAGSRFPDRDRAGADMNAEPLARAAAENAGVHRARTAPIDILVMFCPAEDTLRARVCSDHPLRIVGGMLGERFDGDGVA